MQAQSLWRETEWVWGRQAERTVFRVETVPLGGAGGLSGRIGVWRVR